jgi:predicted naringenin-chalcone synthase
MAAIVGLATGVPETRYQQDEILAQFLIYQGEENRRTRAMKTIFDRAGVEYRHLVVDHSYYDIERTTKSRNDTYMAEAVPLAERVIRCGLEESGYSAQDVDDLIVVSCTGLSVPGLDLLLAGRLGMRHDLRRTCVLGMGCYGAFPALLRAYEAANTGRLAMVVCAELCSLHMQFESSSENVVSSALFSDGAAMALLKNESDDSYHLSPRIVTSYTRCDYQTLDQMAFTVTDHGFRMYLSSYVPDLLAAGIRDFIEDMLTSQGLRPEDIRHWGIHPGSSKIVDYVGEQLNLTKAQTCHSHEVLRLYGNMSSATILFVLDHIQRYGRPQSGDYGVLMAFGPGLTMEAALLQW